MQKMRWPYSDKSLFLRLERAPSALHYAVLEISFFVTRPRVYLSFPSVSYMAFTLF